MIKNMTWKSVIVGEILSENSYKRQLSLIFREVLLDEIYYISIIEKNERTSSGNRVNIY